MWDNFEDGQILASSLLLQECHDPDIEEPRKKW